jgi:hypothetical protein
MQPGEYDYTAKASGYYTDSGRKEFTAEDCDCWDWSNSFLFGDCYCSLNLSVYVPLP